MAKTNPAAPVRVVEETPAYWKVVFDYPPFNILDATIFEGLQDLLVRMNTSQTLRVVVFESAIPDFYLAHFDLTGKTGNITTAVGPVRPPYSDGHVRASYQVPGGQHRKDPGLRPGRQQRVRTRLRHALRVAREYAPRPSRSRGRSASRRRCDRTPSTSGRPRSRPRNHSRRERLRWRHGGTIRIRQPRAARRGAGPIRRWSGVADRLLRSACHRRREESRQ